jgi:hypothetical protein
MENKKFNLIFFILIISCSLTPLYRQDTSDFVIFEDRIEALTNEWVKDTWGKVTSMTEFLREKLLDEDDVQPISEFEKNKRFITYGFGFGYNSIGSVEKSYQFIRFKTYQPSTLFAGLICFILVFQLLTLLFRKLRPLLPFSALLCILFIILFMGYSAEDPSIKIVYGGAFIALIFQLVMMLRVMVQKDNFNIDSIQNKH